MTFMIENQKVEVDLENPRGNDKKYPANSFYMVKNSEKIKIIIEEKVYKLERDENAFLQSIKEINTKQSASIN